MHDDGRPLRAWHGLPIEEWRERWNVPILRIHARVRSTNDLARELAERGAPEGTVVIAEEQTHGRGRLGRAWTGAAGMSLLLSILLRPGARHAVLPLRIGLAAARAIEAVAPVRVRLKWPNDLLIAGRKVAGVLCEAVRVGERTTHVVAGIGINVLQPADSWPPELADTATSVAAEAGCAVERSALAGRVIAEAREAAREGAGPPDADGLGADELAELQRRDSLRGRAVRVDGRPAGLARGIDAAGALLLEAPDGSPARIFTGTVRLATDDDGRSERA